MSANLVVTAEQSFTSDEITAICGRVAVSTDGYIINLGLPGDGSITRDEVPALIACLRYIDALPRRAK